MCMKKFWLARDKDGKLCIYGVKPERNEHGFFTNHKRYVYLHDKWFQEVTWENSPIEIEVNFTINKL